MNLTIGEIKHATGGTLVVRGADESVQVDSVVLDSRLATAGGVFVATPGERVDGHSFIGQVFEKGVSLVVTQKKPEDIPQIPEESWGTYLLVEDSFEALRRIARAYREKLTIPVVGITGSVGKTSTKEFIAGVLGEKYKVLKTEGNYNNDIGVPLTLLRIRDEHEIAVVEMGISDFGEMTLLSSIAKPTVAVITNIGQCHLENLGDRDGVLKAKTEIFGHMDPDGEVCLYGGDDKLLTVKEVHGKRPHFFGLGESEKEEVRMENVRSRGLSGSDGLLKIELKGKEPREIKVRVPLAGKHMVINASAAACVGAVIGLTPEEIAAGIENMKEIGGRNRIIDCENYTIIDDCYNANPVSMRSSIDLLRMGRGKKVAILGDMFELGGTTDEMHEGVGVYAIEAGVQILICVGKTSFHMYEGAVRTRGSAEGIYYYKEKAELIRALQDERRRLIPDDSSILVKASHGMQFPEIVEILKEAGDE